MANWSLPTLASLYSDFLTQSKERDEDAIKMLDGTTSTNLPGGAKRWNATGNKFEKWNGTAWSDLSTLYEIKVRDSDRLNGQTASYYAVSNHGHTAATTTANGFMSSTDKSKLDAIAANANNYSHPTGDGNLHIPANGTTNNGKFLQATGTAGVYTWAALPATTLGTLGVSATAAELNYLTGVTNSVQNQLNAKAPLSSPALTGTPTAPTAAAGTNTEQVATTAFVNSCAIGVNQTWQDVTQNRSAGVIYTNATGKPIFVSITVSSGTGVYRFTVNGVNIGREPGTATYVTISAIVPAGATYVFTSGGGIIAGWSELRQ